MWCSMPLDVAESKLIRRSYLSSKIIHLQGQKKVKLFDFFRIRNITKNRSRFKGIWVGRCYTYISFYNFLSMPWSFCSRDLMCALASRSHSIYKAWFSSAFFLLFYVKYYIFLRPHLQHLYNLPSESVNILLNRKCENSNHLGTCKEITIKA